MTTTSELSQTTVNSSTPPSNCEVPFTTWPACKAPTSFQVCMAAARLRPPRPRPASPPAPGASDAGAPSGRGASPPTQALTTRARPSTMTCNRSSSPCDVRDSPCKHSTVPRRWRLLRKHSAKRSSFSLSNLRREGTALQRACSREIRRVFRSSSTISRRALARSTSSSHVDAATAVHSCGVPARQARAPSTRPAVASVP
mmetsp:Transcript_102867/g.330019  ORF Transcript_102867/g.330019 Transcript_102867/m.330019 type:complete len:200 (-) Transcript_102867:1372-1971(-)